MRLKTVRVKTFRNILDSSPVEIENEVTCIVGKNESGKTALLHAMYRLNSARKNVSFSVPDQYPAWIEKRDQQSGIKLEEVCPIEAEFEFVGNEKQAIKDAFGEGTLSSETITVKRTYSNNKIYGS